MKARARRARAFQTKRRPSTVSAQKPARDARLVGADPPGTRTNEHRQAGGEERARGRPERGLGADEGDEQTTDAGRDEVGRVEDRLVDPVGPLGAQAGLLGDGGQHRQARGGTGRVEEGPERGERHQPGQREVAEGSDDGDRGDAQGAEPVRDDRRTAATHAVDHGAGEQRGAQQRECSRSGDQAGVGRLAR